VTEKSAQSPAASALAADIQAGSTVVRQRLAKALAHPLRIRILVELNKHAMSPTQFMNEIGGASLSRICRQFRALEALGCIELVETKTGGRRRGGVEHFFRATQRVLFDKSSWEGLPDSHKGSVTGEAVTTYIERVEEAIEGGTIDVRDDRHFTWTAMHFDQRAWEEMIEAIDALFGRTLRFGVEAGVRMAKSGEIPIPVTVAFACFESPLANEERFGSVAAASDAPASSLAKDPKGSKVVSQRLAKALAHPLRVRILVELNKRPMSPAQYTNEVGGASLSQVSKQFRQLEKLGCIELVGKASGGQRRGATEHFFQATQQSLFDESNWSSLPMSVRGEVTGVTFTTYIERLAQAAEAGTLDARDDRHLTWTGMHFDHQAWEQVIAAIDALFRHSIALRIKAAGRMVESDEAPIAVTVALACFESPKWSTVSRRRTSF
jgi:DNA-binding transcriptional ArsR family regulator